MTHRPKYSTAPDANHKIPMEFLRDSCGGFEDYKSGNTVAYTANYRGFPILLIDLSKYGGVLTDWIIENTETGTTLWLEVKTPEAYIKKGNSLTAGEEWLKSKAINFRFVVTDDDMAEIMDELTKG